MLLETTKRRRARPVRSAGRRFGRFGLLKLLAPKIWNGKELDLDLPDPLRSQNEVT